jgi:hypothetical protein
MAFVTYVPLRHGLWVQSHQDVSYTHPSQDSY